MMSVLYQVKEAGLSRYYIDTPIDATIDRIDINNVAPEFYTRFSLLILIPDSGLIFGENRIGRAKLLEIIYGFFKAVMQEFGSLRYGIPWLNIKYFEKHFTLLGEYDLKLVPNPDGAFAKKGLQLLVHFKYVP